VEHVAATRCADLRKNILFSSFWNVCGFLEIRLEKTRKKSQKKSVIERSIDRSSRRRSIFFPFFPFFPSRVSCFWSTRTSIRAIILFLVILLTERRERGKSEERREKREKMAASVSWSQRWLRPEVRKIVLFWVYSIHFEEEERFYPLFSRCFIISHQIVLSFIHKIIIKQVYPIFAALGSAVGLCTFFCTRQLTTSPGFTASKAKRATAIPETSQDVKEGEKFRNHFIRRTLSGRRPEIMPGLNSSMTKMN